MSYPTGHTPEARDGVEGLLEQIALKVGAITDEASSVEDKLAAIAVALSLANAATNVASTLASLGLVDTSGSTKWPGSVGDGTVSLVTNAELLTEIVLGFDDLLRLAWQQAIFKAFIVDVTDANYTILASDLGKIIRFNRPTDITVTCPKAFSEGFNCCWLQKGNGQVNFVAESGATVVNVDSHAWSKGPYAVGSLIVESNSDNASAVWYLAGATAIST